MIEALRGQRESISGLCGGADCVLELYHKVPMELDVACFGLDSAGRLSDEQYFVKYVEMRKNQKLVVEKLCQKYPTFTMMFRFRRMPSLILSKMSV